jgi:hypothetical protein
MSDEIFDYPDACFEWELARDKDGYGVVRRGGRTRRAHREMWEQVNGPIPDGMVLLHSCDNPPCIRLSHLSLGTQAENVADMIAKGRHVAPPRRK